MPIFNTYEDRFSRVRQTQDSPIQFPIDSKDPRENRREK